MAKKKATGGKAAKKRPGKGGPRANSGRKLSPEGRLVKISARVPQDVATWVLESSGLKTGEAITQAVRTSPAFLKSQTDQSVN